MPHRISSAFLNVNKRLWVCVLCRNETGIPVLAPCVTNEKRREGERQVTHFCLSDSM